MSKRDWVTTPLRSLHPGPGTRGVILLPGADSVQYLDGAEESVLEWIQQSGDLRSWSDELGSRAVSWAETYHVGVARGNLLRAFDIDESMAVLEIGAGCGALTRVLGETGATVDAVEPVADRARVAGARTRDLDNVSVYAGSLDDVPSDAAYDVVVVVGVLEYVAGGSTPTFEVVSWLSRLGRLLRPGGVLLLAIENKLGVKYLAGAAEDHSNRPFDSVEGYPWPSPARTFSRTQLFEMLASAGFVAGTSLGAFPDYKMVRAVFPSGQPLARQRDIYPKIPIFPSPDWVVSRPNWINEERLWRSLTDAGLADDTANSLVMLAHVAGDDPVQLWPDDQAGVYFADYRRAGRYSFTARIESAHTGMAVRRQVWDVSAGMRGPQWLVHAPQDSRWIPDVDDLGWAAGEMSDDALADILGQWSDLLGSPVARDESGRLAFDLVPHNLVLDSAKRVHLVDIEWFSARHTRDMVLGRGLFYFADRLSTTASGAGRWGGWSVRRLAEHLASIAGIAPEVVHSSGWMDVEAEVQAAVAGVGVDEARSALAERGDRIIDGGELERRTVGLEVISRVESEELHGSRDEARALRHDRECLVADNLRLQEESAQATRTLSETRATLEEVRSSRSFRFARALSALARSVVPARGAAGGASSRTPSPGGDRAGSLARGISVLRTEGPRAAAVKVMDRSRRHLEGSATNQIRMLVGYEDARDVDWTAPPASVAAPVHRPSAPFRTAWIMSPPGESSGGHQNLFRFIHALERAGHEATVYLYHSHPFPIDARYLQEMVRASASYPNVSAQFVAYSNDRGIAPGTDAIFATGWETAYPSYRDTSAAKRFYFVQDFEPSFYPVGTESVLAENTYRFGFSGITAGDWLASKLNSEYGMTAHSFDFGVDHETYRIVNPGVRDDVFFYARPVTPRRGFELGVMALEHVVRERPQTAIHLAGWDVSSYDLPFEHVDYAAMQVTELNDLYNRCGAALVLSLTNLSLLPLELLSSGVIPVVNDGPNNRMVAKNDFVQYAPPSPAALARSILAILDRPDRREHAIAASASVSERQWSKAEQQFLEIFAGEMRG